MTAVLVITDDGVVVERIAVSEYTTEDAGRLGGFALRAICSDVEDAVNKAFGMEQSAKEGAGA